MAKTTHTKLNASDASKNLFEERFDIFTLKMKPISDTMLEQLGQHSVESALNDKDDITICRFFEERGYSRDDTKRWEKRNKKFSALYEARVAIIKSKQETGALLMDPSKKFHRLKERFASRYLEKNHEDWKKHREWESKLSKEETEHASKINIVIPPFAQKADDGKEIL
jgi:hypothetical protein